MERAPARLGPSVMMDECGRRGSGEEALMEKSVDQTNAARM
jgi:hypothetical protein